MATKLITFSYDIPKNKFEREVYRLLSDANRNGNKLISNPTISILADRYREVLESAQNSINEKRYATRLIFVRSNECVALMRKSIKTGIIECFCDVSIKVINRKNII